MIPFLLNLLVAVIWLLLSSDPKALDFIIGFVVGFCLVALFRPVVNGHSYVRRSVALLGFVFVFMREFMVANIRVAGTVLFRPNDSLSPNFITYSVAGLSKAEVLILSYCISLTPGTTTVDVSENFDLIILHALDADDPEAIRRDLDLKLKRRIVAFTR